MLTVARTGWYVAKGDDVPTIETAPASDRIYSMKLQGDGFTAPINSVSIAAGSAAGATLLSHTTDTVRWRYAGAGGLVTFNITFGSNNEVEAFAVRHLAPQT